MLKLALVQLQKYFTENYKIVILHQALRFLKILCIKLSYGNAFNKALKEIGNEILGSLEINHKRQCSSCDFFRINNEVINTTKVDE